MSERPALQRTVVVLGVVSLLTDVASDMVMPLLPAFLASIGGGARALGLIEGAATATSALMKAVDNYQRTKNIAAIEEICHWALERNALNFEARDLLARVLAVQPKKENQQEALLQSQILAVIDKKYPGQVPENIRKANNGRLSKLAGTVGAKGGDGAK